MVNKSEIIKQLLTLIEANIMDKKQTEHVKEYSDILKEWAKEPVTGFPWKRFFPWIGRKSRSTSSSSSSSSNNITTFIKDLLIIDASQMINRLVHKGNFGPTGQSIRYSGMAKNFVRKIDKEVKSCMFLDKNLDRNYFGTIKCEHKIFVGFDNSRATSYAKIPEQRERRFTRLRKEKRKIIVGQDLLDSISKRDEIVPEYWQTLRSWPRYGSKLTELLIDSVLKSDIDLGNDDNIDLLTWRNGILNKFSKFSNTSTASSSYIDVNDRLNSDVYANIGEVDHLSFRLMIEEVNKNDSKTDFSSLIFRMITIDTDLILYSLWFMEYVDQKFDLKASNNSLPNVFIIRPGSRYTKFNVINIKNMYCYLKTHIFKNGDRKNVNINAYLKSIISEKGRENERNFLDTRSPINSKNEYTSVRSFCVAMMGWGNDYMPNVKGISSKSAFEAYLMLGSIFDEKPLLRLEKESGSVLVDYESYEIFYTLMFYRRYNMIKKRCTNKCKRDFDHGGENDYPPCEESMEIMCEKLLRSIAKNNYNIDHVKNEVIKKSNSRRDPLTRFGNRKNIFSRYSCLQMSCYFVDHALGIVPGSSRSLSEIDVISIGNMYENISRKVVENKEMVKKLKNIGLFNPSKIIDYSEVFYKKPSHNKFTKKSNSSSSSSNVNIMKDDDIFHSDSKYKGDAIDENYILSLKTYEEVLCCVFEIEEKKKIPAKKKNIPTKKKIEKKK